MTLQEGLLIASCWLVATMYCVMLTVMWRVRKEGKKAKTEVEPK